MAESQVENDKIQKRILLNNVFTPATPIEKKRFFAGRIDQIGEVIDAAMERGRHAIIYGERGVGKTSLANIISEFLPDPFVLRVAADTATDFNMLWRKIFRRMFITQKQERLGFIPEKSENVLPISDILPNDIELKVDDILVIFERYGSPTILILDEFDRVSDPRTKTHIADTIKAFSDTKREITIVIVGVANTVTELIGQHPSIERNIKQIKLQRMSESELIEIVDNGLTVLEMKTNGAIKEKIARLSQGFPHFTHLLAKYSASEAIVHERQIINELDLSIAIEKAVDDTQESIRVAYQKATIATKQETLFPLVLLAAAIAPLDEFNSFRASDLVEPLRILSGREEIDVPYFTYHLGKLSSEERGFIFEKLGTAKRHRYRFSNPLMKPFITMKGYSDGIVSDEILEKLAELE